MYVDKSIQCNGIYVYPFPQSKSFLAYEKMMKFLDVFKDIINGIKSREADKNHIYDICKELVENSFSFASELIHDENDMDLNFALRTACNDICTSLSKSSSSYKREKLCEKSMQYVAPISKSIGTRWEMQSVPNSPTKYPHRVQNKIEYISIIDTIRKLFLRDDFRTEYFQHNMEKEKHGGHICQDGIYRDFCCGQLYHNIDLFQQYPESIQIQISSDDFETAIAVQSRATIYKVTPVYFRILNMPLKFKSKTDNIFLIALCFTDDLKSHETDFNDIWRLIVNDIKYLETIGIDVSDELNIKGTLVSCVFDNLGARTALGFVESFNTSFYCYICEMPRNECQSSTKANPSYERNMEKYNKHLNIIAESAEVDYSKTKGVKRYCALNDLNYFHIHKNSTLDIMHDCPEGAIMFVLKALFEFLFKHKIIKLEKLQNLIKYFNFGILSPSSHPSILLISKDNLNQNASQALCLFENIPFILWKYQNNEKMKEVWPCIESLMSIVQCVYSYEISENDLTDLENDVRTHLQYFQSSFNKTLKPKQHNLLHYPNIIRKMGPLIHNCMMRYEAKHKEMKGYVNANFKNLTKSLAKKHQQQQMRKTDTFKDNISHGVLTEVKNVCEVERVIIQNHFNGNPEIKITKWLEYHSFRFQAGLFVLVDSKFFEIVQIISIDCDFQFLCSEYDFHEHHKFSNSIKIEKTEPIRHQIIPFQRICSQKAFEAKKMSSEVYVKAATLEFKRLYN